MEGTAGQDENSAFNSVVFFQAVMIIPVSSSQSEALCVYFAKHMSSPERWTGAAFRFVNWKVKFEESESLWLTRLLIGMQESSPW